MGKETRGKRKEGERYRYDGRNDTIPWNEEKVEWKERREVVGMEPADEWNEKKEDGWEFEDEWRKQTHHYFVFTNAGKPVFTRHGEEADLGSYFALMYALLSVAEDDGDQLECVDTDFNRTVFAKEGPMYLVNVSPKQVPEAAARRHLRLLYKQLLAILTKGVEKTLVRRPGYDVRSLLGGTKPILASLLDSFSKNPGYALGAMESLVWPSEMRRGAEAAVLAVAVPGAMCCMLLHNGRVVGLAEAKYCLFPVDDILLLSNFVTSGASLRELENFSPICMPTYNPNSFLYVYVTYFGKETCLVVVSNMAEVFERLTSLRPRVENILNASKITHGLTHEAQMTIHIDDIPALAGGGAIGSTPLWHFLHVHKPSQQYVKCEYRPPLYSDSAREEVCAVYQRMYFDVHSRRGARTSAKPEYQVSDRFVTLVLLGTEFELYLICDPLTDQTTAMRVGNLLGNWLKTQEPLLYCSRKVFRL